MSKTARRSLLVLTTCVAVAIAGLVLSPLTASAQKFEVKSVAEKKIQQLPPGPLFWRIDNFPTLAQAQAAAGPTGLAAEVAGKVWLFTLGPKGGSSPGGSKIAEIGPVPPIDAPEYLLRINNTGGPPGVKTPVHTHPGSETFYVLTGQLSQKSSAWREPYRCRAIHARTWSWHANGGFKQRHRRSECAGHVCYGCHQAVLIAGNDALRQNLCRWSFHAHSKRAK